MLCFDCGRGLELRRGGSGGRKDARTNRDEVVPKSFLSGGEEMVCHSFVNFDKVSLGCTSPLFCSPLTCHHCTSTPVPPRPPHIPLFPPNMTTSTNLVLTNRILLPQSRKHAILVTINRSSKKNCFNTAVCNELAAVFHNVAEEVRQCDEERRATANSKDDDDEDEDITDQIAAVIFTGAGPSFCAGADLSNPPNPLHQSSDLPHHLRWNPVYQMDRIGVPIIGALRGHVITGGFELALGCDILLGDESTTFRDTHVKFGLAPCWGLSQKLSRRIGSGRAKMVSFSARPLNAEKAYEWGLLDEMVDGTCSINSGVEGIDTNNKVLHRALELADQIGSNDSLMVRRYKRAMVEGSSVDYQKGLQRERELGLAHYLEVVGDGSTFEVAKEFIADESRPRLQSKL